MLMAKSKIRLRVITPEMIKFDKEIEFIIMCGADGEFGVLPGHAPLTAALDIGWLRAHDGDEEYYFAIAGGFAEVAATLVTVLTDAAETPEQIDIERAKRAKEHAEYDLMQALEESEVTRTHYALRRALVRLEVSSFPIVQKTK
jgi:F-type H+-transporting ATPase subunit epsilon